LILYEKIGVMYMQKRWQIPENDVEQNKLLAKSLSVSPVLARILMNRGITTAEAGRHFLYDSVDDLANPSGMKDMDKAVHRISQAIDQGERIVIYGDYDVDGITSTSMLYLVLQALGSKPAYYIPERQSEGYGLNREALDELVSRQTQLLITVDCGISSYDDVSLFKDRLDIIITDHHEAPEVVPPAFAVINPKQRGCTYSDKNLAGAGVAYKLCQALWTFRRNEPLQEYIELAALGTIADLVPLTGENRIIVKAGLQRMRQGANVGLQALLAAANLSGDAITAGRIAFTVAPRLNASGRISRAEQGVMLLLATDPAEAREKATELSDMNYQRQDIEHKITDQAMQQLEADGCTRDPALVVCGKQWHSGVIGIVASRLVEQYYRPALVISLDGEVGKGSCRSIEGFNMYDALCSVQDLLVKFGGHPMAAGLTISKKNIPAFRERLNEYAKSHMTAEDYIRRISIDMVLEPEAVTLDLIDELALLEPYGMGNSRPVFLLKHQHVTNCYPIGKTKEHVRLTVGPPQGKRINGVGWSMASECADILEGDSVDVVCTLERNEYNGTCTPQMMLQDIHQSPPAVCLNRAVMVDVYTCLRQILGKRPLPDWQIRQRLLAQLEGIHEGHTLCMALMVLKEIGVLEKIDSADEPEYYMPVIQGKMSLSSSPTFVKYKGE